MKTLQTRNDQPPNTRVEDLKPRDREVKGGTESLSINYTKITYRQIQYDDQHKS